ncbi:MAG: DUF2258 domain-containing protein [Candidatus Aenigmatarchaeota archaeon]
MVTLRSGAVIVGAYATKIRKTLFAQLRDKVKSKEISSQEVARAAGEVNKALYVLFVEKLRLDKGDVVRITIDYEIIDNQIRWQWETLKVEAYRKVPEDEINRYLKEVLEGLEKIATIEAKDYSFKKLRETKLGDVIYEVYKDKKKVGIMIATILEDEVVVRGAIKEPPVLISKVRVKLEENIDNTVTKNFENIIKRAVPSNEEEVEKTIEEISSL